VAEEMAEHETKTALNQCCGSRIRIFNPALLAIYGSGSRLICDIKIILDFSIKMSCLFHIPFEYEGIFFKGYDNIG